MPQLLNPHVRLTAPVITGAGRGRRLKVPTLNLSLEEIPADLKHGIYACRVFVPGKDGWLMGAMHYGPRPVFKDTETLEVHVLDAEITQAPETVTLEVVARLRDVQNFPDAEALKTAIADDIRQTRAILRE